MPIIHEHGGRVDKFVGDGLMAVFGAPSRQPDHADRALAAALEIARAVHRGGDLEVGIGLNSGRVVAGNIGGAGRLEFGVIGDAGQRRGAGRGGDAADRRHGPARRADEGAAAAPSTPS